MKKLFFLIFLIFYSCKKDTIYFTLDVKINPTESGSVNITNGSFYSGENISLKATAFESYTFESWSGSFISDSVAVSFVMNENKEIIANFKLKPFYYHENGITIKARDWVKPGTKGILNGIEYTAVDKDMLIRMNNERKDLSKVVTTLITDMSMLFFPPADSNFDGVLNYYDSFNHEFNQNITSWDLSNVTDMSFMFYSARAFNQDIGIWDVSNVKNMEGLFVYAESFNKDISSWDVSNVTNMKDLFHFAQSFNINLNNWNVSNVNNMNGLFFNATSFNQDIGNWNVSNVTDMGRMFGFWWKESVFNQDIGNWDVSKVSNMKEMFLHNNSFNQDIRNWNVSNVTDMIKMFSWASSFNQNLTKWCVDQIENEPNEFSLGCPLENDNKPKWGIPCN
tara:strand:+ start:117 stop:1298 length:1182 start_codon:yes stop_codon:yes gene_type:complete